MDGKAVLDRARGWLRTFDPGEQRLRVASRTTLALGLALLVLYLLTRAANQPVTVSLLGVVISMMSSMAVNDPNPRQQRDTLLLAPLPAAAAVTLGALLAPYRVASDVVFVAIMFAATAARRFGPRGMALGMLGYITYFFAIFLRATVSQLPWLILAVFIGIGSAFIMRIWLLPDQPERLLGGLLAAFRVRVEAIIALVRDTLATGHIAPRDSGRFTLALTQLNEAALAIEDQADQVDPGTVWPGVTREELALSTLDVELAAERVAEAGWQVAQLANQHLDAVRADLLGALDRAHLALRDPAAPEAAAPEMGSPPSVADEGSEERRATSAKRQFEAALARLATTIANLDALTTGHYLHVRSIPLLGERAANEQHDPGAEESVPSPAAHTGNGERKARFQLHPTTRQAIQVAVATSVAIFAGNLLSPSRWYWAVITAFIVFIGTSTRGQTLTRGWQRILGTVAGIPAGMLVATLAGGSAVISLVLIFVCIFFLFYSLRTAYWLMTFWITTVLALLYGLLGLYSFGLLLLRLEETAIGAAIGILAASILLPTSTRATVRNDMRGFLAALGEFLDQTMRLLNGEAEGADPIATTRDLDRCLRQLRDDAQPLTSGLSGVRNRSNARNVVRLLVGCAYYARDLARIGELLHPTPEVAVWPAIERAAEQLRGNLDAVIAHLDHNQPAIVQPAAPLLDAAEEAASAGDRWALEMPSAASAGVHAAIHDLRAIDYLVLRLAANLGATVRASDEAGPAPAPQAEHV